MMKTIIAVTLALAALMLGLDKVRNEHAMTREYRRQADALERIADSAQVTMQLRDKKDRVIVRYGTRVALTPAVINGRKASDFPDHDATCARYSAPTADGMQMCWEQR
jgi:hypothetical protein